MHDAMKVVPPPASALIYSYAYSMSMHTHHTALLWLRISQNLGTFTLTSACSVLASSVLSLTQRTLSMSLIWMGAVPLTGRSAQTFFWLALIHRFNFKEFQFLMKSKLGEKISKFGDQVDANSNSTLVYAVSWCFYSEKVILLVG